MISIISTLLLLYFIAILYIWKAWVKLPYLSKLHEFEHSISVIVAVRNEERNIEALLNALKAQKYTTFEVIVVDDHSDDATARLIDEFDFEKLSLIHAVGQGKKAAIRQAIGITKGDVVAFTDGDCMMGDEWLAAINGYFIESDKVIGCGAVNFKECTSTFEKMQQIEFASLIGVGAAFLGLKKPTMCNGANIFYKKALFEEVNGFEGNDHF